MTESSSTPIQKQDVLKALLELRVNRPRRAADRHIRYLLNQFGNGASNIHDLKSEFYPAVYAAAGGATTCSPEERYGVMLNVPIIEATTCSPEEFYGTTVDVPMIDATKPAKIIITPAAPSAPPRVRSPLTIDLEARLAAVKAKTKRSTPGGRVDLGSASQVGDQQDDVVRNFPAGEILQ
jgi:hypothetical protein